MERIEKALYMGATYKLNTELYPNEAGKLLDCLNRLKELESLVDKLVFDSSVLAAAGLFDHRSGVIKNHLELMAQVKEIRNG